MVDMSSDINKLSKLWPFEEAKKLLNRFKDNTWESKICIFQTGYGPSGLPHIGTFGEVLRTSMVIKAFKQISNIETKLLVFSDDMDGLRKIPDNIPNREVIEKNLYKSLSNIPDPFQKFKSFADHNNFKLREFLDRFNFKYEFKSATQLYKSGYFNNGLKNILLNYEKVCNVILPTLGKERRNTYSPFLPICSSTGEVLQVKILEKDLKRNTILFYNPNSKKSEEISILNGFCKLQWKVDWAMRWKELSVDYEMNGKDLIESFQLSSRVNKIIGGKPPNNLTYELFLDEKGEKISKSRGNGISVDEWLQYSPSESLELFMFQSPKKAKRLFFDVIPKTTDEFIKFGNNFDLENKDNNIDNPLWFIESKIFEETMPPGLTFNMILNLASVCGAENSEILWSFIENYYPNVDKKKMIFLSKLLDAGVNFYQNFILPNKKFRKPNEKEKKGLIDLINFLKSLNGKEKSEEIQKGIYNIGMGLNYENLREWFLAFYEVVLGQKEGPRIGSFIKFYGIDKTIDLIEEKIKI